MKKERRKKEKKKTRTLQSKFVDFPDALTVMGMENID